MLNQPVGIFDSGLGGLSVMRAVSEDLPNEDLLYFGDCSHAPYGDRSEAFITERVFRIADFLIEHNAKAIVVACNTATAASVPALRERLSIPVIGIEPAVKPAAAQTRTGTVGVMATTRTIQSERFASLLERFGGNAARVIPIACPGLADAVEAGKGSAPETMALLERYLDPLIKADCDKIVLGCTHYPFLADEIASFFPEGSVELIDPSHAVARQLRRKLEENHSLASDRTVPRKEEFYISGPTENTEKIIASLLKRPVKVLSADL